MLTQRSHHPLPQQGAAEGHRIDDQQAKHQFCPHRREIQADYLVVKDDDGQTVVQLSLIHI